MAAYTGRPSRLTSLASYRQLLAGHGHESVLVNASGCHGKAEGQNGFKLSVFGFDPAADYASLVKEGRGRRLLPAAPEMSLLVRKMSGSMAHGGGTRIRAELPIQ